MKNDEDEHVVVGGEDEIDHGHGYGQTMTPSYSCSSEFYLDTFGTTTPMPRHILARWGARKHRRKAKNGELKCLLRFAYPFGIRVCADKQVNASLDGRVLRVELPIDDWGSYAHGSRALGDSKVVEDVDAPADAVTHKAKKRKTVMTVADEAQDVSVVSTAVGDDMQTSSRDSGQSNTVTGRLASDSKKKFVQVQDAVAIEILDSVNNKLDAHRIQIQAAVAQKISAIDKKLLAKLERSKRRKLIKKQIIQKVKEEEALKKRQLKQREKRRRAREQQSDDKP